MILYLIVAVVCVSTGLLMVSAGFKKNQLLFQLGIGLLLFAIGIVFLMANWKVGMDIVTSLFTINIVWIGLLSFGVRWLSIWK